MLGLAFAIARVIVVKALPNFVFILSDDQGLYSVGFKNPEILTPAIDQLAVTGAILDEFYTYKFCSPTRFEIPLDLSNAFLYSLKLCRAAFLTGRYPWKAEGIRTNLEPLQNTIEGTNLGFTFLPQRLKEKGYATHHIGKWHQGFADYRYTPTARGFDTTYGFFGGQEDHFTQVSPRFDACGPNITIIDNWKNGNPYPKGIGEPNDEKFAAEAVKIINNHISTYGIGGQVPLFLYLAFNTPHSPIQALQKQLNKYPSIKYPLQKTFYAMVSSLDDAVYNVTTALKQSGLWDNTLLVFQADNGSPIAPTGGGVCGSNYPFKGAKSSNWEGGVRVPALVNGGLLPDSQRGQVLKGIGHITDWYATFLTLAEISTADPNPLSPSPIDSVNLWPWISGLQPNSPRVEVVLEFSLIPNQGFPAFGAIRRGSYKLLVGPQSFASWYGGPQNNYFSPNQSVPSPNQSITECDYNKPCLFDIEKDPYEHVDLAAILPDITALLLNAWHAYDHVYHVPITAPKADGTEYFKRLASNGGVVAPYLSVPYQLLSLSPTAAPVLNPTTAPTLLPSVAPSAGPTKEPSYRPTAEPRRKPTNNIFYWLMSRIFFLFFDDLDIWD